MPRVHVRRGQLLELLVVAALYYLTARLSLELSLVGRSVTPLWLPTGVAVVALGSRGLWIWPALTVAALAVNLPLSRSATALLIAAGNTASPLLAAYVLRRLRFDPGLSHPRDGVVLSGAALACATLSATVGASSLVLSGAVHSGSFDSTWLVWWTGDAMGMLLVAPFLWTLVGLPERVRRCPARERRAAAATGSVFAGILVAVTLVATHVEAPVLFVVFPLLIWAAWQYRQHGAAPAALVVSVIATFAAVDRSGFFMHLSLVDRMLTLQLFNAAVAFSALFLAAAAAERARVLARLREVAQVTQRAIIMPPAPSIGPVTLAADYRSATDHAAVGGDLYDAAETPFGARLLIGDVRGKGLEAVHAAASVLRAFRGSVQAATDLSTLVSEVVERSAAGLGEEEFITALFVEISRSGQVRIANLGHPAPLHVGRGGLRSLQPTRPALPMGLGSAPAVDVFEFEPSDRLLLFTDGLAEGRDREGRFFPLDQAASETLRAPDLQVALAGLLDRFERHVDGQVSDDIAVLLAAWSDTGRSGLDPGLPGRRAMADRGVPAASPT